MTIPVSFLNTAAATTGSTATQSSSGAQSGSGAAGSGDRSQLSSQAFLQLLVAELQYQDPSNPVDTSSFMQQSATLSQVQTMNTMSSTLTALVNAQQAQTATNLLGKTITYSDSAGVQHTGTVTSAALLSTGATVKVGDVDVPLSQVMGVSTTPSGTPA